MLDWKHRDWNTVDEWCKEFILNFWDVLFGIIAVVGAVLNCLLFIHFKGRMKGSVFLTLLAICDFTACIFYLWLYTVPLFIVILKSDILANLFSYAEYPLVFIRDFFDLILPFLIFFIVFEKLLWTCESSTRHFCRRFTEGSKKFCLICWLVVIGAVMSVFRNYPSYGFFDSHNFCGFLMYDTNFVHNRELRLIQTYLPRIINFITFILVVITIFRIKKIGRGQTPVNQEEINLGAEEENTGETDSSRINATRIQRSIICILIICSLFVLHFPLWKYFFNAVHIWLERKRLSAFFSQEEVMEVADNMIQSTIKSRWIYDSMGMMFSTMRMAFYYIICRNDVIVEYSANNRLQ